LPDDIGKTKRIPAPQIMIRCDVPRSLPGGVRFHIGPLLQTTEYVLENIKPAQLIMIEFIEPNF
jgi:hypothetical protein